MYRSFLMHRMKFNTRDYKLFVVRWYKYVCSVQRVYTYSGKDNSSLNEGERKTKINTHLHLTKRILFN